MLESIIDLKIYGSGSRKKNRVLLRLAVGGVIRYRPPILEEINTALREGKRLTVLSDRFPENAVMLSLTQVIIDQGTYDPEGHPSHPSLTWDEDAGWVLYFTVILREITEESKP